MAFIILLLSLLLVFFQDWKYRRIHVILPVVIFLCSLYVICQESILQLKNISVNLLFLIVTLGVLTVYMSLKNKQFLNPFQNYFGLGDLLFYTAITPLFELQNYILFFILSMIFAIGLQLGLKKIITENTVPLAGFSAFFLCLVILKDSLQLFQKITLL